MKVARKVVEMVRNLDAYAAAVMGWRSAAAKATSWVALLVDKWDVSTVAWKDESWAAL